VASALADHHCQYHSLNSLNYVSQEVELEACNSSDPDS